MKVVIIEGPDNCGKNTLIQNILEKNDVVKVIHCHKPDKDVFDPFTEMRYIYNKYAENIISDSYYNIIDIILFNRYYQSEYIYGQLYRNGDPLLIKDYISDLETYLLNNIDYDDMYYIQLTSSSVNLLINHEDGQSLSKGDTDKIKKELELFDEIYDFSKLKKHKIYINNGDEFRSKEDILIEFNDFINSNI